MLYQYLRYLIVNRRGFLTALLTGSFLAVTSQADARCRRRWCGPACCATNYLASQRKHEPWADRTSITILIGGRYSSYAQYEDNSRANVYRWHIPEGNNFYWAAHDRCWRNCYGAGSIGYNSDQYFSWYPDSAAAPDEDKILKHAERLCSICKWLHDQGVVHIRLVGHSAGANICNFATHQIVKWLGNQFRFSQLILLSPPVPFPRAKTPSSRNTTNTHSRLFRNLRRSNSTTFDPVQILCYPACTKSVSSTTILISATMSIPTFAPLPMRSVNRSFPSWQLLTIGNRAQYELGKTKDFGE